MIANHDLGAVHKLELKYLVLCNLPPGEVVEFFTLQWLIHAVPQ